MLQHVVMLLRRWMRLTVRRHPGAAAAVAARPRCGVAVRNMPLSADELRKKLALKDGGDSYVFGTTAADGTHVILLCKRI